MGLPIPAKVFVFWGQSNMVSQGGNSDEVPAGLARFPERVFIWRVDTQKIVSYITGVTSSTISGFKWGPEAQFLYDYAVAHPGDFIFAMKYAVGGTAMAPITTDNWLPGSNSLFTQAADNLRSLMATLRIQGYAPDLQTIIGMQGETDSLDTQATADAYRANKISFYQNALLYWAKEFPNVKFIDGRIGVNNGTYKDTVRNNQICAASVTSNAFIVDTDDLTNISPGNIHFDGDSLVTLGHRFYQSYMGTYDDSGLPACDA